LLAGSIFTSPFAILSSTIFFCLHQNLEEELQGLESSQNHVIKESIACRSKLADSDAKNWNRLSPDIASG